MISSGLDVALTTIKEDLFNRPLSTSRRDEQKRGRACSNIYNVEYPTIVWFFPKNNNVFRKFCCLKGLLDLLSNLMATKKKTSGTVYGVV